MPIEYTATVDGKSYGFDYEGQVIYIDATIDNMLVANLWTAIKEAQAVEEGMPHFRIATGGGTDVLGTGIETFLTVTLLDNWEVSTLKTSGKFEVSGGNLIREDQADPFLDNPSITYIAFLSQAGIATTVETGSAVLPTDVTAIAEAARDEVWNAILTGANYNIPASAGRRLRQIASQVVWDGKAQGPGTGTNQIQLDADASATNGAYDPALIAIVDGTGAGQSRVILEYNGATKTATVDRDWKINPDATSDFVIYADAGRQHVNEGLAQAGGASTITLNALASSADDAYKSQLVFIRSGTGADQVKVVSSYNGATKVATVSEPWVIVPDSTSAYTMIPVHVHEVTEIQNGLAKTSEVFGAAMLKG